MRCWNSSSYHYSSFRVKRIYISPLDLIMDSNPTKDCTMKVTDLIVTTNRREPKANPNRDAIQALTSPGSVSVTIQTDEGHSGSGNSNFGRVAGAPDALSAVIEHVLKPLVVGRDVELLRHIRQELLRETEYHSSVGLAMFGIAAIDTALWDCLGKARGVPCWQLWGGQRERVPAYAMVGWINYGDDEVQKICAGAVEQGFQAVKIKVGYPTLKEDLHRIQVVREAVGPDIRIMADANQSLTTAEAVIRGRAYQDHDIYWWEEPIPADDLDGYAELARSLDIPVATGENLYTPADFARFLKHDAVDVVQADLRRAGGPTALLQIGLMAAAFNRPYASHGGGPVQLSVMACLPNTLYLETGMIPEGSPLRLENGTVNVPDGPGFSWK
jgi:L-alanine-DL-glutamate epimerase-like enolase superfamily enzyme